LVRDQSTTINSGELIENWLNLRAVMLVRSRYGLIRGLPENERKGRSLNSTIAALRVAQDDSVVFQVIRRRVP